MEDNVALGIRISVTVVLVASLVAIVLTLMVIGQSILGGGQNKLQTGLSTIQQQDLIQYSNVTKKGSVVKAALNLYQGEPVAILVKTTALHTAATDGDGAAATASATSGIGKYFNYGTLLDGAGTVTWTPANGGGSHMILDAGTTGAGPNLVTRTGVAHLEASLDITNGIKNTNYDTAGVVSIGNPESILDNGLFYCQLVKDITGEIIGIVFTQQK
jgi:hypothetical protein